MKEELVKIIKTIIEEHSSCDWKDDAYGGYFVYKIYVDYRDEGFDYEWIIKWCDSEKTNNPYEAFNDSIMSAYEVYTWEVESELIDMVRDHWDSEEFPWNENEEEITDWFREHLSFEYPTKHYLNQKVAVDIIVDTGDGNYDFVANSVYPHYDGEYGKPVPEEASILWLARQQGWGKRELNRALRHMEYNGSELLKSLREEVLNCSTHMNALTFFVEMTVERLLDLQVELREKSDACMVLGKDSNCGLYDPWNGAGSLLDITLEKEVRLPYKYIDSALPDGGRGYGAANVYGMSYDFWKPTILATNSKAYDEIKNKKGE